MNNGETLNTNQKVFLNLLRAGLWADAGLAESWNQGYAESVDWDEVYQLAEEQSVIGVVLDGIEHSKVKPPQELLLQWIGEVQMLEQQNRAMNQFIAELIEKLRSSDIYALLVKGQGIAQCYNRPFLRVSGDIDLLLSDSNYKKAKTYLVPLATSIEEEDTHELHLGMEIMSWPVELHGTLRSNSLPKMDKVIDDTQNDVFFGGNVRSWVNVKTQVFLPGVDNDVIFVFSHFIKHFFRGGIGLRQICDWCRLMWTYKDTLNRDLLESRIRKAEIMSEWQAFASLAVNTLGMPEEAMPLYSSDKKWKRKAGKILKIILASGNFGHNTDLSYLNKYGASRRKLAIVWNGTKENFSHFFIFPLDSIRAWCRMITKGVSFFFTGKR